jgi:hypothetical protein
MPDCHAALGPDVLEEPAEQRQDVELGGAEAGTAHLPVGDGDGTVGARDDAAVGHSHFADRGGAGGAGGVAVVMGLSRDVPGDGPDLGGARRQQVGLAHGFFEARAGDRGEGFDGDQAGGAGGAPSRAVLGEACARDASGDVRVVRELPAPGMQAPGAPRQIGAHKALGGGEPFAGARRGGAQGLIGGTVVRAADGLARCRDGAGEEDVGPGSRLVEGVLEPLRGCMLWTRGTVAVATGRLDAVGPPTAGPLRETVPVMATAALGDGAADRAVCEGQVGIARQGLGRKRRADRTERGQGRRPCRRAPTRSEASSCPWCVR